MGWIKAIIDVHQRSLLWYTPFVRFLNSTLPSLYLRIECGVSTLKAGHKDSIAYSRPYQYSKGFSHMCNLSVFLVKFATDLTGMSAGLAATTSISTTNTVAFAQIQIMGKLHGKSCNLSATPGASYIHLEICDLSHSV